MLPIRATLDVNADPNVRLRLEARAKMDDAAFLQLLALAARCGSQLRGAQEHEMQLRGLAGGGEGAVDWTFADVVARDPRVYAATERLLEAIASCELEPRPSGKDEGESGRSKAVVPTVK